MKLEKFKMEIKKGRSDYGLLPVEFFEDEKSQIPFKVVKTYFVLGGETDSKSGQHAHFEEKEVFLVLKGKAQLISLDEKGDEYHINMEVGDAVYVPNLFWHGFSKIEAGAVIVAFSSEHHNPDRSDYIEDKEKFLSL